MERKLNYFTRGKSKILFFSAYSDEKRVGFHQFRVVMLFSAC